MLYTRYVHALWPFIGLNVAHHFVLHILYWYIYDTDEYSNSDLQYLIFFFLLMTVYGLEFKFIILS